MLFYGKVISKDNQVQLAQVDFEIETIGNNAKVKATHTINNNSNDDCNVAVSITLDDESAVTGYSFKTQNGEFVSQLKEKEKAKTEQSDATASGYSSALMEQIDDTTFSVSLGLVQRHSEVSFSIEYLTHMDIDENELVLKIPNLIEKENQLPYSIKVTGNSSFSFKGILTGEEEINVPLNNTAMMAMKDEDTDEVVVSSTFINKETEGNINVIFICDRSGSMSGEGIGALRNMLQLFLRQLPINSKFQIISFGSSFDFMFKEMMIYDEKPLNEASEKVSKFQADYGGTSMHLPLEGLMKNKTENCHIIVLTDGYVDSKLTTIEYVKTLSQKNSIHAVGLGSNCDVDLIRSIGRIGNGISAISKNPNLLKKEVSKITQRILIPSISNCQIEWNIKGELTPKEITNFYGMITCFIQSNDEIKENQLIQCNLKGKCGKKEIKYENQFNSQISNGIVLHQLMALHQIRKLEVENKQEEAKKLSLKYNVLCKQTAFIAIDKTTKKEVDFVENVDLSEIHKEYLLQYEEEEKKCFELSIRRNEEMKRQEEERKQYGLLKRREEEERMKRVNYETQRKEKEMERFEETKRKIEKDEKEYALFSESSTADKGSSFENQEKIKINQNDSKKEKKELVLNKQTGNEELFQRVIECQTASGSFEGIEKLFCEITKFYKVNIEINIIQTIFVVELLKFKFKELKEEWKLIISKSEKWLTNKKDNLTELRNEIINFVHSLIL